MPARHWRHHGATEDTPERIAAIRSEADWEEADSRLRRPRPKGRGRRRAVPFPFFGADGPQEQNLRPLPQTSQRHWEEVGDLCPIRLGREHDDCGAPARAEACARAGVSVWGGDLSEGFCQGLRHWLVSQT